MIFKVLESASARQSEMRKGPEISEYFGDKETFNSLIKDMANTLNSDEYGYKLEEEWKYHTFSYEEINSLIEGVLASRTLDTEAANALSFFDCDNSNDTCELTKEIYYHLWGWEKGYKTDFGPSMVYGKFVLVPAGFNSHRGIHRYLRDYWDLSLKYLAYVKTSWLPRAEEAGIEQNEEFAKYINTFFLWDYVDKKKVGEKEYYEVKPLFPSHKGRLEDQNLFSPEPPNIICSIPEDFKEFLKNVNGFIKRRGKFMIAMLKIAVLLPQEELKYEFKGEHKDEWKDWKVSEIYKEIMEKVFLADELYSDYRDIIQKIEEIAEVKNNTKVQEILEEMK